MKINRFWFAGAWICIFISTFFAVTLQFFKGDILDFAIQREIQSTIKSAALLFAFILGEVLFVYCYNLFSARFVVGCTKCLKQDIFKSILNRGYVDYKEHQTGEYIAKYTNEVDAVKARYFSMLTLFWNVLFKIIFVSAALFWLDYRIAIITLVLLTTPLYIPKLIEKRLQQAQTEYVQAVKNNLAKVNDWLSGFEIIKNFSIEEKIMARFEESNNITMEKLFRDTQLGAISKLITALISYLSYFIVLACAAWLVCTGTFSAGDFFVAIGMIDQLSYPLISLAEIIRQLIAIKPVCKSMEEFSEISSKANTGSNLRKLDTDIRFKDVSFSYDGRTAILQDFNFIINKGSRYLLKGPSGCGKTTAINLLLRYYEVGSGEITINGVPLKTFVNVKSYAPHKSCAAVHWRRLL